MEMEWLEMLIKSGCSRVALAKLIEMFTESSKTMRFARPPTRFSAPRIDNTEIIFNNAHVAGRSSSGNFGV